LELVEVSLLIYRFSFLFIVYNYFKRSWAATQISVRALNSRNFLA
jgi:hypothetical protein